MRPRYRLGSRCALNADTLHGNPKRRRRFALPAHSKINPITAARGADMQAGCLRSRREDIDRSQAAPLQSAESRPTLLYLDAVEQEKQNLAVEELIKSSHVVVADNFQVTAPTATPSSSPLK